MNRKLVLAMALIVLMMLLSSCSLVTRLVTAKETRIWDSIHGVYTPDDPDHILVEEYDVD